MADNWLRFPYAKKPYADSTLRNMTKAQLIQVIRDYEHNYAALYEANERGAAWALEKFKIGGFELSEERKCGEWHDHYQIDSEYYVVTCSVCGCTSSFTDAWLPSYCPNCGAEMKGAREDA